MMLMTEGGLVPNEGFHRLIVSRTWSRCPASKNLPMGSQGSASRVFKGAMVMSINKLLRQ